MRAMSEAVSRLEANGHFGPFVAVLGQGLFLVAQTPTQARSCCRRTVLSRSWAVVRCFDRRHSTRSWGLVALWQRSGARRLNSLSRPTYAPSSCNSAAEPVFIFRVCEKMTVRIKEPEAIMQLWM